MTFNISQYGHYLSSPYSATSDTRESVCGVTVSMSAQIQFFSCCRSLISSATQKHSRIVKSGLP